LLQKLAKTEKGKGGENKDKYTEGPESLLTNLN